MSQGIGNEKHRSYEWVCYLTATALAFCSVGFELLIARTLTSLTNDVVTSQCVTLGIYLFFLGLGTSVYSRVQQQDPRETLFWIETGLATVGALSILIIYVEFALFQIFFGVSSQDQITPFQRSLILILGAQIGTASIGFLSGFEIPLISQWSSQNVRPPADRSTASRVVGASYLGTLLVSFVLPVWCFTRLDVLSLSMLIAGLNSGIAWIFFWKSPQTRIRRKLAALSLAPMMFLAQLQWGESARQILLKLAYSDLQVTRWAWTDLRMFPALLRSLPAVRRISTPYQEIDFVHFKGPSERWDQLLFLNSALQFSTRSERLYHESMAHGSINAAQTIPRNVLILGGGDGLLARELLRYGDRISTITLVELDDEMIRLANSTDGFARLNGGSLKHPKVNIVVGDAFHYLKRTRKSYDAVFIDFPFPDSLDLAKLYSVEFYGLVLKVLEPEGFVSLDFPLVDLTHAKKIPSRPTRQDVLISTLEAAGVQSWLAFGSVESFLVFAPGRRDLALASDRWGNLISNRTLVNLLPLTREQLQLQLSPQYVNSVFKPTRPQDYDL